MKTLMPPLLRALLLACGWVALLLPPCPFYAAAAQPAAGRRQESGAPAKTGLHQHSNSYRSGLSRSVCNRRILLKLGERRVYIYEGERVLASYPVAVGKKGWETPTGRFRVIHKVRHPRWKSPWSGRISPPGPRSPLGERPPAGTGRVPRLRAHAQPGHQGHVRPGGNRDAGHCGTLGLGNGFSRPGKAMWPWTYSEPG